MYIKYKNKIFCIKDDQHKFIPFFELSLFPLEKEVNYIINSLAFTNSTRISNEK